MVNAPRRGDSPTGSSHWAPLLEQRHGQVEVVVNGREECTLELVTGDDPLPDNTSRGGGLLACTSNDRTMTALARRATTISTSLGPSLIPTVVDLVGRMEHEAHGAARRPLPVIYCCENDHEEVRATRSTRAYAFL